MTERYGNDRPYCNSSVEQKPATANEYEYGTFGVRGGPSLGGGAGGGEGFRTRVKDRRGSVTKYSFEIQEASLTVAVEALVLNAEAYRDQLSSGTASPSSLLYANLSPERSNKAIPTQTTYNGR